MRSERRVLLSAAPFLAIALLGFPSAAQHMNTSDAPCTGPLTTATAAQCFASALAAREQDLAKLLAEIRPAVAGDELSLLTRAQGAWTDYRRLSCEAEYAMYGGGTGGPVNRLACQEALTRDRIKHLHDAYEWRLEEHKWTVEHPTGP